MMVVADAAVFIAGVEGAEFVTVREVIEELRSTDARLRAEVALSSGKLRVLEASEPWVSRVRRAAAESGDAARLSETDIKLLALALELAEREEVVVMSDDYSVQNLASLLGLRFMPVAEAGIKRRFGWRKVCTGCGRVYPPEHRGECTFCGSEVRLRRKKGRARGR